VTVVSKKHVPKHDVYSIHNTFKARITQIYVKKKIRAGYQRWFISKFITDWFKFLLNIRIVGHKAYDKVQFCLKTSL